MRIGERSLLVVGDRVLVRPEEGESVTDTGLILPASVADREAVQTGRVVALGPGYALSPSDVNVDEDWSSARREPRYVALQARVGDLAVFYKKAAVRISVSGENLVVVPHASILVLLRDELELDTTEATVN